MKQQQFAKNCCKVLNDECQKLTQTYISSTDKQLGRVILGSFMFARGKELDHWNEMVANQKEQVAHWHTLS